jgi:hypothetical protein
MWSKRRPSVAHIRVFKSIAYAMVSSKKRRKFNAKGIKYVLLGYNKGTKI